MADSGDNNTPQESGLSIDEKKPSDIDQIQSHAEGSMFTIQVGKDNLARVDEAIESIGWGKYHWQLAVTCSFGFLVDQVALSLKLV
jgi:hypothetical protein